MAKLEIEDAFAALRADLLRIEGAVNADRLTSLLGCTEIARIAYFALGGCLVASDEKASRAHVQRLITKVSQHCTALGILDAAQSLYPLESEPRVSLPPCADCGLTPDDPRWEQDGLEHRCSIDAALLKAFPWAGSLPRKARGQMVAALIATLATRDGTEIEQQLHEWKGTAAIHADPTLAQQLATPLERCEDGRPVPKPIEPTGR